MGGALLDSALEEFWGRLGYAVIQGYDLAETAPMVAWNHPFKPKHGAVGGPLEGIEVRIAANGEIVVKGLTVTTGCLNAPVETQTALEGGWIHTGNLGAFDDSGHLVIQGRKRDLIATSEGLKVFPGGVERALRHTWHGPRRGNVRVTFGAPLVLGGDDFVALTQRVQEAVVALQPQPIDTSHRASGPAA